MIEPFRLEVDSQRGAAREVQRHHLRTLLGESDRPTPTGVQLLDRLHFTVKGMAGRQDARRLEARLAALDGVERAQVRFETDRAVVSVLDERVGPALIASIIRAAGFEAHQVIELSSTPEERRNETHAALWTTVWMVALPALAVLISELVVGYLGLGSPRLRQFVTDAELYVTAVCLWLGRSLFSAMLQRFSLRRAAVEVPMGLAASIAFGVSVWAFFTGGEPRFELACALVWGYHLGLWLESWWLRRAQSHFRDLIRLRPRFAAVQREGGEYRISLRDLTLEDRVRVHPGELIPVDGVIESDAHCVVDESSVLGAGIQTQKGQGDEVFAGTTATSAGLSIRPTAIGEATVLGRMLAAVELARTTRSPSQRRSDRAAALVAPITLLLALGTFLWWRLGAGQLGLWDAVAPALAVLIITTPWAIGWSSAVPVMAAMTGAARRGVLMRDPAVLDEIRALDSVVFEKAGVLTHGRPEIESFEIFGRITPLRAARFILAVERQSNHVVAQAFEEYASEELAAGATDDLPEARSFRSVPGRGVIARVDDSEVVVGASALLVDKGIEHPSEPSMPGTWLYLAVDGKLRARARIYDPLREDSKDAVGRVRAAGVTPLLVTADAQQSATVLGASVGVQPANVRSAIDGAEHAQVVRVLRAAGHRTGAVGLADKDMPTLDAAHTAFAMVRRAAVPDTRHSVLLLRPGPGGLIAAFDAADRSTRVTRGNLVLSVLVMSAGVPAAMGYLPPLITVGALVASLLAVGLNGLRA